MTGFHDELRWLRWLVLDHLLLIILFLMMVSVFGILLIKPATRLWQEDYTLQRSLPELP